MPLAGDPLKITDSFNLVTFTPTWTGVTLGTGVVNEGWYCQEGSVVQWGFRLQLGTGAALTATVLVDLPVTAWSGGGSGLQAVVGAWVARDNSGPLNYAGSMSLFASSGVNAAFSLGNNTARMSNTVPGGGLGAIDDVISGSGVYRAA